ncbi:MAG: TlpA family protein disulfide reductase [Candidatus Actinomarina sp.]|tara:strand:+ start:516 stop:1010 length:495 start_codon:yes stop_codon:yes gene_type:complete
MIKRNFILILLTVTVGIAIFNSSSSIEETNNISDINNGIEMSSLKKLDSLNIKNIQTDYIVLNLWASWCIPCQNEVDDLIKVSQEKDITVIGILVDDSLSNGIEFISKYKVTYDNILEEQESDIVLSQFSWSGIPTTLLLDKNLIIIHTINGEITSNEIIDLTK